MTFHPESDSPGLSPRPKTPRTALGAQPGPPSVGGAGGISGPSERGSRLRALVELLEDDSRGIRASVRTALLETGRPALAPLRRAATSRNPKLRGRARELNLELERGLVLRRLFRRAANPDLDLESSLLLLARIENPSFDARPYVKALNAMGAEVEKRAAAETDDFTRPMVLPEYLGNDLGFVGGEVDFDHPDHIHLHRAIETKRGMPLTLCAIYLFVARRAGLRAAILPLPGHVLLRVYSGNRALIIDPFHGGTIRRRLDCVRYLAQHGMVPQPAWFRDASDAAMFERHVRNLMSSHQNRGRMRLSRDLHRVASIAGQVGRGVPQKEVGTSDTKVQGSGESS